RVAAPVGTVPACGRGRSDHMSTTELTESPIGLRRWDEPEHLPLLAGLHVLVVDDDEDAREAVAGVLETCGAEVVAVGSAPAALALLRQARPDVIVSDIAMPGMDGHRLIRTIRTLGAAQGGTPPAAALTAYATPSDRTRALLAGFQVYLAKPFDPIALISRVPTRAAKTPATGAARGLVENGARRRVARPASGGRLRVAGVLARCS